MCLDTVTSRTRDRKREGFGWKVFKIIDGVLENEYYDGRIPIIEGCWLKSNDEGGYQNYPLGFHIFRTREEARIWKRWSNRNRVVKKVMFRDVLAEGKQLHYGCSLRVIVAKEIMIL